MMIRTVAVRPACLNSLSDAESEVPRNFAGIGESSLATDRRGRFAQSPPGGVGGVDDRQRLVTDRLPPAYFTGVPTTTTI